jgi:hypothetical protein
MSETLLITTPGRCGGLCILSRSGLHRRGGGGGITLGQQLSEQLVFLFKLLQLFLKLLQIW